MSALKNDRDELRPFPSERRKYKAAEPTFEPQPCGEVDYDALVDEVTRKYPRILARLGE